MIDFIIVDSQDAVGARRFARSHAMKYVRRRQRANQGQDGQAAESRAPWHSERVWREHRISRRKLRVVTNVSSQDEKAYCSSSPLSPLGNGSVQRNALFAALVRGYLGGTARLSDSFELDMRRWTVPTSRLESHASSAMILLFIGSTKNDRRLLLEARRRHLSATQRLRTELALSNNLDRVLAVAQMLLGCEHYSAVSAGASADTWSIHIVGIQTLLRIIANAGKKPRLPDELRFSLEQSRHITLMHALVHRQMTPCVSLWQLCTIPLLSRSGDSLTRLALRLPALLELADSLDADHILDAQRALTLRRDLHQLELDMKHWACTWHSSISSSSGLPEDSDCKVYSLQSQPSVTLPKTRFSSSAQASQLTLYWTCLLLVREALARLTECGSARMNDTDACADQICQAIPYLLEAADGPLSKALAVRGQLYFASRWWQNRNQTKFQWCYEVELQLRGKLWYLNWDALLPHSFPMIYSATDSDGPTVPYQRAAISLTPSSLHHGGLGRRTSDDAATGKGLQRQ